jgi:hypothetical protein
MKKPPAKTAVVAGIRRGLSSKETAYEYGYTLRALHEAARRMKVSFPYTGTGRPPRYVQKA